MKKTFTASSAAVIKLFLPLTALLLTSIGPVSAMPTVQIARCYDGDTCTSTTGEKIRLACIDTPELRGSRANPGPARLARDYLRVIIQGRKVGIRRVDTDRYGRTVAELFSNEINVNQAMVSSGHAEIFRRYAKPCAWAH